MNTKTLSITLLSGLIMVSILFLSACSPFGGVPVVMAQPDYFEETTSRTWEIDADDIAAAREAAETLSQNYDAVGVDFEEMDVTRSWEIGPEDIAAAREAAETLSQNYDAGFGVDLEEEDFLRSWEIGAEDIAAAREAAEILSNR